MIHVAAAPALVAGVVVGVDARAGVRDHHYLQVIRDGRKRTRISYVCFSPLYPSPPCDHFWMNT